MPSIPGIPMSMSTRSGVCADASSTASLPVVARAITRKRPSPSSVSVTSAARRSSSSQMSMRSADSDTRREPATASRTMRHMVIDGHNDLVLHRWRHEPTEHLDLDAARAAGFAGGFFALYVPSGHVPDPVETPYEVPLPEPIPHAEAARIAEELFDALCALPVRRARTADDFVEGEITAIVHMEGAEP